MALAPAVDLAVVGGGIVGLATASELQHRSPGATVAVLEARTDLGLAQTGHNSGVIHTGVYYAPGSLKARLCVDGAAAMREFCEERSIPVLRCGKLIVATGEHELTGLDELERRGRANGVPGLERVDAAGISEREPNVRGVAALWSPEAAVVDFRAVALALAGEIRQAGGQIETGWAVARIAGRDDGALLVARDGRQLEARRVITCAGAGSDRLAVASGAPADPRIVPFRGSYLSVGPECAGLVSAMVYPVPDPSLPFLGVHLTPTIEGGLTIGPTALLTPTLRAVLWPGTARMAWRHRRAAAGELRMAASRRALIAAAHRYVPALRAGDVLPGSSHGVRAQAVGRDGTLVDDFAFSETGSVLHVRNAPSPAATSSLAIAAHIADRLSSRSFRAPVGAENDVSAG